MPMSVPAEKAAPVFKPASDTLAKARVRTLLALPAATLLALAVHWFASKSEPLADTHSYSVLLGLMLGGAVAASAVQPVWPGLRRWMMHLCPIIAAAVLLVCVWEVITSGFRWLPLPYFP